VGLLLNGGVRRYVLNRQEHTRLSTRLALAEDRVARKQGLVGLAQKDDALLETEARRQLGLLREGEIEFRFVSEAEGGERLETSDPR
jgi:cell division protein FtsB